MLSVFNINPSNTSDQNRQNIYDQVFSNFTDTLLNQKTIFNKKFTTSTLSVIKSLSSNIRDVPKKLYDIRRNFLDLLSKNMAADRVNKAIAMDSFLTFHSQVYEQYFSTNSTENTTNIDVLSNSLNRFLGVTLSTLNIGENIKTTTSYVSTHLFRYSSSNSPTSTPLNVLNGTLFQTNQLLSNQSLQNFRFVQYQTNPFSSNTTGNKLSSSIISINMVDDSGSNINVNNTNKSMTITILTPNANNQSVCMFNDEVNMVWVLIPIISFVPNVSITCETNHLTSFGAFDGPKQIVPTKFTAELYLLFLLVLIPVGIFIIVFILIILLLAIVMVRKKMIEKRKKLEKDASRFKKLLSDDQELKDLDGDIYNIGI
jgi:uncharacterized membrane protein